MDRAGADDVGGARGAAETLGPRLGRGHPVQLWDVRRGPCRRRSRPHATDRQGRARDRLLGASGLHRSWVCDPCGGSADDARAESSRCDPCRDPSRQGERGQRSCSPQAGFRDGGRAAGQDLRAGRDRSELCLEDGSRQLGSKGHETRQRVSVVWPRRVIPRSASALPCSLSASRGPAPLLSIGAGKAPQRPFGTRPVLRRARVLGHQEPRDRPPPGSFCGRWPDRARQPGEALSPPPLLEDARRVLPRRRARGLGLGAARR